MAFEGIETCITDEKVWQKIDKTVKELMESAYTLDALLARSAEWGITHRTITDSLQELLYGNPIIQFYRGAHYAKDVEAWKGHKFAEVLKSDGKEKRNG